MSILVPIGSQVKLITAAKPHGDCPVGKHTTGLGILVLHYAQGHPVRHKSIYIPCCTKCGHWATETDIISECIY